LFVRYVNYRLTLTLTEAQYGLLVLKISNETINRGWSITALLLSFWCCTAQENLLLGTVQCGRRASTPTGKGKSDCRLETAFPGVFSVEVNLHWEVGEDWNGSTRKFG